MTRRLALSLALIAAGAALFAASARTGGGVTDGGIFRYGTTAASVQLDPQLGYVTSAWWLEYATALKLVNWPDRPGPAGTRFVLEAARSFAVSNRGKTYTFVIRKGLRFSDGSPVTARSFAYAIDRTANKRLASPGAAFITDPYGTNIVGAKRVNDGHASHVSGVIAKGYRLVVRLARPDGSFLSKLTLPFFQATSTKLPLDREVSSAYPSAGPYAFTKHVPDSVTKVRRNRYYQGSRPQHLSGVDVLWNLPDYVCNGDFPPCPQLDELTVPEFAVAAIAKKYGVNKNRFWSKPTPCVGWLLLNGAEGVFKNNLRLRQALSWAVDRTSYAAQAGPYAASPWTRLFPPGFPGLLRASPAPSAATPRIAKARRLAKGHFGSGKIVLAYLANSGANSAQAEVVRRALIRLGFEPSNITMRGFSGTYFEFPPRSGWDVATNSGWCADFTDPREFFLPLLGDGFGLPRLIASPAYREKIAAASKLVGNARLRAFGRLELDVDRNLVPVVPMRTYNNLFFFSNRVDPRSLAYQPVYADWSIPRLALK